MHLSSEAASGCWSYFCCVASALPVPKLGTAIFLADATAALAAAPALYSIADPADCAYSQPAFALATRMAPLSTYFRLALRGFYSFRLACNPS